MITDDDRGAAAAWDRRNGKAIRALNILRGSCDTAPLVQAFAAHRELGAQQEREAVVAFVERYPTLDWAIGKAMRSLAIAIAARKHGPVVDVG